MGNGLIPLNYAVLKYFEDGQEHSTSEVMQALEGLYKGYRKFKIAGIEDILMTGVVNGLLDETRYDLDESGDLRNFYQINDYGREQMDRYIGKYNNPSTASSVKLSA